MAEQNNQNHKSVTGHVDRVFFHDENSGKSILSVTKDDGKFCRVIGIIKDVAVEDVITATGAWKKDEKYGWQFMAESLQKTADDDQMHALDFSNVLNNTLKEFRNVEAIIDYSEDKERFGEYGEEYEEDGDDECCEEDVDPEILKLANEFPDEPEAPQDKGVKE